MGRLGEALSLSGISEAGGEALEISNLFVRWGAFGGDGMEFVGVEAQIAGPGDRMDGCRAKAFFGEDSQQQPVCDFSVGEDSAFSQSSAGATDSACEEGLGAEV